MLEKAKEYILDLVLENEEVKKFPKDFVTASMQWIRSWFLTDDDPLSKAIFDLPGNEAAKQIIVEQKLPKLLENPDFKQQLEDKIAEFSAQKASIKNLIENSNIESQGKVHIGDRGVSSGDQYNQKNVVRGSTIKSGGNIRIGDDNIHAGGNVHLGDIHFHNATHAGKTDLGVSATSAITQTLRTLIASGRTGEAIPKLLDHVEAHAPHLLNETSLLFARWETLKRKERNGVLSNAEANVERNQVNDALLGLVGEIEKR